MGETSTKSGPNAPLEGGSEASPDNALLARRQARMERSPAILRGGFRLFFLGGAAWAAIALALWLLAFTGVVPVPSAFDPLAWHRHEMLFGFVGAIIAGFLLAAIPNWTSRIPIAGAPAAALFGLWLAGRLAVLFSGILGLLPALLIDVGFYLVFAAVAAREVIAANNRNLPIVGLVLLLGLANLLDHLGAALIVDPALGARAGIMLVVLLITLIGGRIVPAFTRNWLVKNGKTERLPGPHSHFDTLVIAATGAALLLWVVASMSWMAAILLAFAGVLQAGRLSRWTGWRAARDPLVIILHIGYAWIPVGLLLLAAAIPFPAIVPAAPIHALTAGAMATMILAVMTRATLGHTGCPLKASGSTVAIYACVTASALGRVASSLDIIPYMRGVEVSGLLWCAAFALFLIVYGPLLCGSRRDGRLY